MHETEKQKINLIYNHNFKQSFDLTVQENSSIQDYTKSFKRRASGKDARFYTSARRLIQVLPTLLLPI